MDVAAQLTSESLAEGVAELARRDPHLAAVVARHGAPPLWDRPPGFGTLVQIILEQPIVAGEFDPDGLAALDDEEARAALIKLRGVGAWTADIYLLMALGRADIWPSGDLALVAAIREVKRLRSLPTSDRIGRITRTW